MKILANLGLSLIFLCNQILPNPTPKLALASSTSTPAPVSIAYPPPVIPTPTPAPTPQPLSPPVIPTPIELTPQTAQLAPASGATLSAFNGNLRVIFPEGALSEDAQVWITRTDPPSTLSGQPFQIIAKGAVSQNWITHFPVPLQIELDLDPKTIPGDPRQLTLFYYNESARDWYPLPSWFDLKQKIFHAQTDHLTVFDFDLQNWQAARLPALTGEVAAFTGAATYSYPLQLPEGPGGLKPSLALHYNSQIADAATLQTQASWVGMGWNLDTGSIERDLHGTPDYLEDDTFNLNVGGISSALLPGNDGFYHTTEESFWRIQLVTSTNTWKVWDQQGTRYDFEDKVNFPRWDYDDGICDYAGLAVWRWSLTRIRNIHGQELTYSYYHEQQGTQNGCEGENPAYRTFDYAVYPTTIRYPHQRYQVRFEIEPRTDYNLGWGSTGSRVFYQKYRLKNVYVEQDNNGDGVFETMMRRYAFTYSGSTATRIFPGHIWSAGTANLTLDSLQEFGMNGTNLPATTFTYDGLHLTLINNGYGGRLEFGYESAPWYEDQGAPLSASILEDMGVWLPYRINACIYGADDTREWNAVAPASIECGGGWLDITGGEANKRIPQRLVRPGGRYLVTTRHTATLQVGLRDGSTLALKPASSASPLTAVLEIPASTSGENLRAAAVCTACSLDSYDIRLVLSRYRVIQQRVYDGIQANPIVTASSYNTPNSNDPVSALYPLVSACLDDNPENDICYEEPYSQFRGHAWTQVNSPDGRQVTTWFHQSTGKSGRAHQVETRDASGNLPIWQEKNWSWIEGCDGFCGAGNLPHPEITSNPFIDLKLGWIKLNDETQKHYEVGSTQFVESKQTYTYDKAHQNDTQYGNLTSQLTSQSVLGENGLELKPIRITDIHYFPNPSGSEGRQLTGLPAYSETYACTPPDCSGKTLAAETWYLYDGATATQKTAPPSSGKLTARRTRVDGTKFSDETYAYDSWGNLTTTTRYSGYGSLAGLASTGAQITTTKYDPTYHTYPAAEINAMGQVTHRYFDTALGVVVGETDPNGARTGGEWNGLGQLLKIIRPGDSSTAPTVTITYHNYASSSAPFWTEATQRVNATQSLTVRKFYNGLGELIQTQQGNMVLEDNACSTDADTNPDTCSVVTNTKVEYSGGVKKTKQSAPYAVASPSGYLTPTWNDVTETTYDALGRVIMVKSPWQTDNTSQRFAYSADAIGLKTTTTDPKGNVTQSWADALGRTLQVKPALGAWISYTYDALDRLKQADHHEFYSYGTFATTSLIYDLGGRKTNLSDPDMGAWIYEYDGLNLIKQTDAQNCNTELDYDNLNRLTDKSYTGCPTTTAPVYKYDATTLDDSFTGTVLNANWEASGNVSVSGGQAHLAGVGDYNTWIRRPTTGGLVSDQMEVQLEVKISQSNGIFEAFLRRGTWGAADYRRWAIFFNSNGTITAGRMIGTTDDTTHALGTYQANTWYVLQMLVDSQGEFVARVWQRDNPAVYAQWREKMPANENWSYTDWQFYARGRVGTTDVDQYTEALAYARGRRTSMTDGSGGTTWRYDGRGQVVQENKTIGGTTYTSRWSYNSASLPVTLTYPDNEVVTTTYLPQMAVNGLSGASNYVSETRYDAAGRAKTRALGSGAVTSYTYKPWSSPVGGALATIQTSNALQNLSYNYDGNGNIISLVDIYNGQTETLVYEYDALNRLTAVSNALSESYDYDARGNLKIKGGQTLYYDDAAHKHAATGYNGNTYAYDENGNMKTRVVNGVTTTLDYDGENRLVGASWQNHSAQFVYDGDGRRVKSVVDGTATDYVGAHYEVQGSVVTKYYFAGGQAVALRQGGVLSYLFSDHLGSTTVTTDSSGTKTAEMRYKPWGETRYTSGTTPTARHYTGQYEESGIGLYFYNARWYDPLLGRFAQADTLIPQPGSPLAWDRYGYVMNNPVKYNDPTGHCIGPLLYFCILGGLYVADHIAIIGAVALTGAVLSYVGNSAPDMELVNDKAASQVEFENRTAQSQAWLLLYGGARIVADITSPPATTALSKETSANPVTPRSETSNYTKVEYQGRNIYQRNDIDWDYIDPKSGFTNRELAANGNAPFGPDRKPINLHHLLQQEPGPMAEVPATVHQRGQKILHGLLEDGQSFRNIPGLENQYNQFRKNYWEWRATNLE